MIVSAGCPTTIPAHSIKVRVRIRIRIRVRIRVKVRVELTCHTGNSPRDKILKKDYSQ